ncbi:hypothetical protein IWQ60_002002 [Tieghemiomyces parasiticus]|uniref:Uncharacterized protein n=1 Tax=Tieghemiomyces parasiticus TaxID=78921 RepID=A0A9W8E1D5_9FUNG|nr:hypothetical protein IWQ60_002002 [Tieghemiomyces parasiticus]
MSETNGVPPIPPVPRPPRRAERILRDVVVSSTTVALLFSLTVLIGTGLKEWYALGHYTSVLNPGPSAGPTPELGRAAAQVVGETIGAHPLVDPLMNIQLTTPALHHLVYFFGNKHNVLNVVFAKWGWAWTTGAFATYVGAVINRRCPGSWTQFATRWAAATAYWYLLTQWAFGPSLFDRVFVGSGGQCSAGSDILTYARCRLARGTWSGGHDISGHCMLLVHASLFLWEELSPFLFNRASFTTFHPDWTRRAVAGLVYLFMALWYVLLIATATFYHNVFEKLNGLIFGVLYWLMAYHFLFPTVSYPGVPANVAADVADEEMAKRA